MTHHWVDFMEREAISRAESRNPKSSAKETMFFSLGRNCSGGSRRRMVTGKPFIARNNSLNSSRCMGRIVVGASTSCLAWCQQHLTHRSECFWLKEHVLRTTETAHGAQLSGFQCIGTVVGIGAYLQDGAFISPSQELLYDTRFCSGGNVLTGPSMTSPEPPSMVIQSFDDVIASVKEFSS